MSPAGAAENTRPNLRMAVGAGFRRSRTAGADGGVFLTVRCGRLTRQIATDIRGADEDVLLAEKYRIAEALMTIYCVIERVTATEPEEPVEALLDSIAALSRQALSAFRNPYAERLEQARAASSDSRRYRISRRVATVAKLFADRFEYAPEAPVAEADVSTLTGYLDTLVAGYRAEGRNFARSLRSTRLSLQTFLDGRDLLLAELTPELIRAYGCWLRERVSADTASFYLRTLHVAVNRALDEGRLPAGFRWPGEIRSAVSRQGCAEPAGNTLTREEISRLEQLPLDDEPALALARDMFMFSFYTKGMELADIAALTRANLHADLLVYRRRGQGQEVTVSLGPRAVALIEKYRDDGREALFPLTQRRRAYSFSTVRAEVSAALAEIGARLGLQHKLRFSAARDTHRALTASLNIAELLL